MTGQRLAISDLTVTYGGITALRNISLEVGDQELVVLLGPNGAGKTTLLRTIAGLKSPAQGRIAVDGKEISRMPAFRRARTGVVLVPEGRHVFPRLTVYENLLLGGWGKRRPGRELEEVIGQFPVLSERRNQLAGMLSGGEQQMLALARALMRSPRLLLLDEPSMGLAPAMANQVFMLIEKIRARGVAILLVEQSTRHALGIASRAYILQHGAITLECRAEELKDPDKVLALYFGTEPEA